MFFLIILCIQFLNSSKDSCIVVKMNFPIYSSIISQDHSIARGKFTLTIYVKPSFPRDLFCSVDGKVKWIILKSFSRKKNHRS